jgi:hypothetical protein
MLNARLVPLAQLARMKHDHGALMGALWAFADRDGKCWPSLRTLAEFCAMPLSKVQRAVRQMESLGYIAIERGRHFVYRIADHLLLRPRSPMAETQSPAGETEGVAKKETQELDKGDSDLGRSAPSAEEQAAVHQLVNEATAQLTGRPVAAIEAKRSGIADDAAYQADIRRRKREHWLGGLASWACRRFQGNQLETALAVIEVALKAGSSAATPAPERKLLNQMDRLYRPTAITRRQRQEAWKETTRAQSLMAA